MLGLVERLNMTNLTCKYTHDWTSFKCDHNLMNWPCCAENSDNSGFSVSGKCCYHTLCLIKHLIA